MARPPINIGFNFKPTLARSSLGVLYPHQPRLRYYTYHESDRIGAYETTFVIQAEKQRYHKKKIQEASNRLDQLLEGDE